MRRLDFKGKFISVDSIKAEINRVTQAQLANVGYVRPGHGWKGKQELLDCDDDVVEMYTMYGKKSDILLWCHLMSEESRAETSRKRAKVDGNSTPCPKRSTVCAQKISDVEKIVETLKNKHGSLYSIEQLNAWAHMIDVGKSHSYETPPDLPYFRGHKKVREGTAADDSISMSPRSSSSPVQQATVSPGKRITMRSQLLAQMEQWHSLLEKGGITQEQYDELKSAILKDIYSNTFN